MTKRRAAQPAVRDCIKLHAYQKKTVQFFVSRGAAGAFLDPG